MTIRPKLSRATETQIERTRRNHPDQLEFPLEPEEVYREACEDEDGNRYVVIVWHPIPGLSTTVYSLDDGRTVKFVDDCLFEIADTGTIISRCA